MRPVEEYNPIAFDQVEQLSDTWYMDMFSRLRCLKKCPIPCGMRSAASPIGGSWSAIKGTNDAKQQMAAKGSSDSVNLD